MVGSFMYIKRKMAGTVVSAIFIILTCLQCVQSGNQDVSDITVQFVNERPVAVSIPLSFIPKSDVDIQKMSISLADTEISILGEYERNQHSVKFIPAIPFRRNLTYIIKYDRTTINQFSIPGRSKSGRSTLTNIYPSADTVPENFLKIHLEFSKPMSELHSSQYVSLLNENGDTLNHIFLRLDPELWNYDHTMLTLWLEPGRIKKSLLPNVLDGIPIEERKQYTIVVSEKWKSAEGIPLQKAVHKQIYVSSRDERMPMVDQWAILVPKSSTQEPLTISFNEVLDYTSLMGSFNVLNSKGTQVDGVFHILPGEAGVEFIPEQAWHTGKYSIQVEWSVEDLAANNLNRLFDRDLKKDSSQIVESDKVIYFEIRYPTNQ
ncbi:MAG: hypothetical protein RIA62_15400 [Cyclobacteriaceae bacterium]